MPHLSDQSLQYRTATRLMGALSLVALAGAFGGARGWVPVAVGVASGLVFAVTALLVVVLGVRGHRQALEDREKQNRLGMILMVAGQLSKHDDAMLERIAGRGGLAGDAARLILQGRRERQGRASPPRG